MLQGGIEQKSGLPSDTVTDPSVMLGVLGLVKQSISKNRAFGVLSTREAGPWQRVVLGIANEAVRQCIDSEDRQQSSLSFGDIVFESSFQLMTRAALPSNPTSHDDLRSHAVEQIPQAAAWLRDAFDMVIPCINCVSD